ncbi:hypothetical protein R3P38DRAFT_2779083 [Favolaschia claudopus]|uniref:BTB domain-containing protein n=1 Tax=Favolaschia claudopus TaxID=2862362 RepID=A0AAW0BGJ8_9AGAR
MAMITQTFTDAPAPFDDPNADIIVRSSENVDFRTSKVLLALASPFFKEMFEVPQPAAATDGEEPPDTRNGIPVISMYDDRNRVCSKDVLEYILNSFYPAHVQLKKQPALSPKLFNSIVDVTARYRLIPCIRSAIRDPYLLQVRPFMLFAHACHYDFAEEIVSTAEETLRFRTEHFPLDDGLKLISGYQYQMLIDCHRRCGKISAGIARGSDQGWIASNAMLPQNHAPCCRDYRFGVYDWASRLDGSPPPPSWWVECMDKIAQELQPRPHASTISIHVRGMHKSLATASACTICCPFVDHFKGNFVAVLQQKIEAICHQIIKETAFV